MNVDVAIVTRAISADVKRLLDRLEHMPSENHDVTVQVVAEDPGIDSPAGAERLADRIWLTSIPQGRGIAYNRNRAVDACDGDVVVFVDDDCWPTEEWLDELLSPFADPEVGAVMGNVRIARSTFLGDSISALGFPGGGSAGYAVMFGVDENGRTKHFSTLNCAIRRDVIVRLGGFDERLTAGAEDKELSHRVSGAGVGIMFQPSAIVEHRARASLSEFSRWFFRRGKAVRQFSRIVPAGEAIRLRLMSYGQLLRMHVTDPKIVLIAPLLVASIVLQQAGYMREVLGESGNARARETDTAPEG